ncbi:DUF2235 domain-containing protein [Bosea vestrisii]|uniref:DUF2235 domain-containing protein n=1 Tax=Bosea vestrisii TaxID=151416 RepID=UPI0024DFBB68|nr:DUF2235 domain-containing protein [Bosea vestrisii]WID97470.1 DUF2235 domain-containing protein [Bosea vestrisii]
MQDNAPSQQSSIASASPVATDKPPLRRHLLFLDGTWNSDDREGEQTHIVRLRNLAMPKVKAAAAGGKPENTICLQSIYYDSGVGTGLSRLDRFVGGAIGAGLSTNVRQAYRYLSAVYHPGDEICVFGFSRGAYTARSLVGYIAASGLLRREHCSEANETAAWAYYRIPPKQRFPGSAASRDRLVHENVRIRAMGVFDTVGALGIPSTWARVINRLFLQFHDTEVSRIVDYAFHALAIDEKREPFQAAVWQRPRHEEFKRIEQVWFPGVHSDIGGGYSDHRLGDIVLNWMIERLTRGPGTEAEPHVHFYGAQGPMPPAPRRKSARVTASSASGASARRLGPIEPDEDTQTPGVTDDNLAPQNESRTTLYRLLYPWPLLRLIGQTWPRGDRAAIRRSFAVNEFQPFQDPIGEMVHWCALVRLGRSVEIAQTASAKDKPSVYAPPNLVAVLPNILMTYVRDGDQLSGSHQDALDGMSQLAADMRRKAAADRDIHEVRVIRHLPDPGAPELLRVRELDPEIAEDCVTVLGQLLRLWRAGLLSAA